MTDLTLPKLRERKFAGPLKAFENYADAREASKWLREVLKYGAEGTGPAGGFLTPIETLTNAIIAFRDRVGLARRFANVRSPLTLLRSPDEAATPSPHLSLPRI